MTTEDRSSVLYELSSSGISSCPGREGSRSKLEHEKRGREGAGGGEAEERRAVRNLVEMRIEDPELFYHLGGEFVV